MNRIPSQFKITAVDTLCCVFFGLCLQANAGGFHKSSTCDVSAAYVYSACYYETNDDYLVAKATCLNMEDESAREECLDEIRDEKRENRHFCGEQYQARISLCDALHENKYDTGDFWRPENFVDPADIGGLVSANPYWPLLPSVSKLGNEDEDITVTVTAKTKLIEGVTCVVVNDVVAEDGQPVEDTDDWYAQDVDGNVWYCGEISKSYELFEGDSPLEAELVDVDGSWKAFRDGAQPGIVMKALPQVGDVYRQEMMLGDAEDAAEVIAVNVDGLLEGDECEEGGEEVADLVDELCDGDCLVTHEFTPVEPDASEHKYYAPNIGLILEVNPDGECTVIENDD